MLPNCRGGRAVPRPGLPDCSRPKEDNEQKRKSEPLWSALSRNLRPAG